MSIKKEIQYILRRVSLSDLKKLLELVLSEQSGCYYKTKLKNGYGMFYRVVMDEMSDVIFHRMADYDLLNDDESTEEEEINIINKGLDEMFSKTVKEHYDNLKCRTISETKNDKKHIKKILKEETEKFETIRIESAVKKMINFLTKDIEFPENFYDFMVDIIQDEKYDENILRVSTVMKKPFSDEESTRLYNIKRKIMPQIEGFFKSHFDRFSYGGTSTLEVYLRDKERDNLNPNF